MSVADPQQLPQLDSKVAALFPLPLTTFEAFMVIDARPDYPMMCDMELQFQGSLDRTAFEAALTFALVRNPLFSCRVERQRDGTLAWVPTRQLPEVDWAAWGAPLGDRYGTYMDLTVGPGMRIWVRQGEDQSTVLLHFQHAHCDGIGGFGFIEDILAGYALAVSGPTSVTPRPLKAERLSGRGAAGMAGRGMLRRISDTFVGAKEGAKFFLQAPRPLAAAQERPAAIENDVAGPAFITVAIQKSVAADLRRGATAAGATLNDLLMRDLFVTLRAWNAARGEMPSQGKLRILMPQSLRSRDDYAMPAANVMGFAFVTRSCKGCDAPDQLLESIREETEAVRRGQLSLYFIGGLASLHSAGILPWVLRRPFCFASAVLTNLSDPTRRFSTRFERVKQGLVVGNVVFTGVAAVPPLRPNTRAAFAVINHGETFSISLKCDPRGYSALDAQHLLGQYVEQLGATATAVAAGGLAPPSEAPTS